MGRTRRLRLAAIVAMVSFPLTGILLFATVATVIGEDRLEGPDAVPGLGPALVWLPFVVGAVLLGWSFTSWPTPSLRAGAVAVIAAGVLATAAGILSLATGDEGDANIGGALLVVAGPIALVAGRLLRRPGEPDAGGSDGPV